MCNIFNLNGAKVENFFINDIYQLVDVDWDTFNNMYEKEVASVFTTIAMIQRKQTILLGHHFQSLGYIYNAIKECSPELKCEVYNTFYNKNAKESLEQFERGELQFLLAELDEMKKSEIFKGVIHDQIRNGNILMGLNICSNNTPHGKLERPIVTDELIELRIMFPEQKWMVFTDYHYDYRFLPKFLSKCDQKVPKLKNMCNYLHFNNSKVTIISCTGRNTFLLSNNSLTTTNN